MADFVAYTSRWRSVLLAFLSLGFVVLGCWMVGAFGPPPASLRYPEGETVVVGWFGIAFFGFCAVGWGKQVFATKEQLRIGALGIRWARWSSQTIPWSEITDVTSWSYRGQRSIVLHLRDATRFPAQGVLGAVAGANRMLTGGDIAVSLTGTDQSFDAAMSAISLFKNRVTSAA